MSKRLILVLAVALVAGMTVAAYAEVQNVKVSGDLAVMGIFRDNLDLAKDPVSGSPLNTDRSRDEHTYLSSITRVRVDADLTDNVMTTVRLLNERNWNGDSTTASSTNVNVYGYGTTMLNGGANADEKQIDLDLAFVTLKEFLYSPLTLTIGRQEMRFNNGWIVGDPDTNGIAGQSALAAGDLSARKAFDAIRATLDYSPLIVDVIYAKVDESNVARNDDVTLVGANASYELTKSTMLEGFFYSKHRGSNAAAVTNLDTGLTTSFGDGSTNKNQTDKVHTVGGRVVNRSIKNLVLDFQAAYQFGTYNPKFDPNARWFVDGPIYKAETAPRRAWGLELYAGYDLSENSKIGKYSPMLSATYVYLSGEDRDRTGDSKYRGWDPMFEDQTMGHLMNAMFGFSNVHLVGLSAQAKPKDDITMKVDWVMSWFTQKYPLGRLAILSGANGATQFRMGENPYIGQEIDTTITYDYTEDVQFSLLTGIFLPGDSINEFDGVNNANRVHASEVIGSMKVTF